MPPFAEAITDEGSKARPPPLKGDHLWFLIGLVQGT